MPALTVMIIRHAEKPGEDWPGPGLTVEGMPDPKSLVIRGWQRAGAWAALFGACNNPTYPSPNVIYAAKPDTDNTVEPSQRPYGTVIPLAARLPFNPVTKWAKGQERELAAEIATRSGVVLVSWEHKLIPGALLPALLQGQTPSGVPTQWHRSRYDVVLRLDRPDADAPWQFRQLFPCLLAGDSDAPL